MADNQDAPAAPAANVVEVRRTISPYDLTSADNPGAVISHPLLRGDNYDEWACGVKTALTSRKKFGFLDGTIARPVEGSPDLEDWKTIQALLVSWIKMTISEALRSTISHRDVAQELWEYLKKRFSVMSGSRLLQLKGELASCKQRGTTIESYYGKLNHIWDNLASHRPIQTCACGLCTCNLRTAQEAEQEKDKVLQFLIGLDEQYRAVRSSLVSRTPIQTLEEVYNIVRHEEDMRLTGDDRAEVTAFAVQNRSRFRTEDKAAVVCSHCNRSGHSSENCFAVIGYPDWWGERPKGRTTQGKGRGGGAGGSMGGKGRGHTAYVNQVNVPSIDTNRETANHVVTDSERDGLTGLTDQQWRTLKAMLNAAPEPASEKMSGPRFEDGDWSG